MPMFRKRPVVIEARQLAGTTSDVHGVYQWIESHTAGSFEPLAVLDGDAPAPESGVSIDPGTGERSATSSGTSAKPDIFSATYEPADETRGKS